MCAHWGTVETSDRRKYVNIGTATVVVFWCSFERIVDSVVHRVPLEVGAASRNENVGV